jgi:hypothetical protein
MAMSVSFQETEGSPAATCDRFGASNRELKGNRRKVLAADAEHISPKSVAKSTSAGAQ